MIKLSEEYTLELWDVWPELFVNERYIVFKDVPESVRKAAKFIIASHYEQKPEFLRFSRLFKNGDRIRTDVVNYD